MGIEIIALLLGGVASLLTGGIVASELARKIARLAFGSPAEEPASYAERLSILTQKLDSASSEVDDVLREIVLVAENRQKTVEKLEKELPLLESKEQELKERITALKNTPVEVAEHFAELISVGEKRGAKRDYFLFGAGVLVTTVIGITIQIFAA